MPLLPIGKIYFFFFSFFSKLAGECTYACTSSNLRLNFWLLTANNYLQYPAIFILGKKYCKQWMDGSGGQGSIAWCIVVLCLSSQWALTLVMYVLLGNYRVWELLPVTQEVSAHAGWHLAPLLCSTAKPAQVTMLAIPFPFQNCFFLFASWWVALLCNKPTNLLCGCVSHLPSGTAGLWPPPAGSGNAACGWPGCTGCRMGAGMLTCFRVLAGEGAMQNIQQVGSVLVSWV